MATEGIIELHPAIEPEHRKSIYERVAGDFQSGLAMASKLMREYLAIKSRQDIVKAVWQAEIDSLRLQIADLEKSRDRAAERYQWDLDKRLTLLDGFRDDFASELPKNLTGFDTPAGRFTRTKNREKTVKEPDNKVMDILRALPFDAQEQAIELKPAVNWKWVQAHLKETDDGPVLTFTDEETGEVFDVPAVIEEERPADGIAYVPIIRTISPEAPYKMTIEPTTAKESLAEDGNE